MEALTYRMEGDYQVPNLAVLEEPPVADKLVCGKYALLQKKHLKQHNRILFVNLLTSGRLNEHLMEIELAANERMEQLIEQMASAQSVTEELKASDQMKWVGLMNNIRNSAEETILSDLIYN